MIAGDPAGGAAAALPTTGKDDLLMVEWAECRATIGRMDSALEDLRKYGFTLVTGLLTAGGLVGGASTSDTAPDLVPAAAAIVMVLVLGLFAVDMFYQVVLSGAVERALDLEVKTNPPVRLTRYVSDNAQHSFAILAIPVVYTAFLGTAAAMAWFVKGAHNGGVIVLAIVIFVLMLAYFILGVLYAGKLLAQKADRIWPEGNVRA